MGASGLVVTADLRLDAREDLLRDLDLSGDARHLPDGALLCRALERWGVEAALDRLVGPFAFAAWDPGRRRLFLARDPVGSRSLFIHRGPGLIAFSTRLRPLLSMRGVPLDLDELALGQWLTFDTQRPERTVYRAVDRIPTGHLAVLTEGDMRLSRWWLPPSPGDLRLHSDAEVEEAGAEVIDRVVRAATRCDGPPAIALSGGMDSATVALSAADQMAPERLIALTRLPDAEPPPKTATAFHDEGPRAAAFAALHPGIDWHGIRDDGGDWGERDPRRWFLESGQPCRSFMNVVWFFPLYRFMAERGGRVFISGVGGNAFYSADGRTRLTDLFRTLRWGTLAAELTAMARFRQTGVLPLFKAQVLKPLEPWRFRRWRRGQSPIRWYDIAAMNPGFAEELRLDERLDRHNLRIRNGLSHWSRDRLYHGFFTDEVANDTQGVVRAVSGIDWRAPLWDRRVVEFFGALPLDQFLRNGVSRSLPRRMLAGKVPPETLNGTSLGKQNGDWFGRMSLRLPAMRADLERLRASSLARRVVDLDRLEGIMNRWPTDAVSAEPNRRTFFQVLDRGMDLASFLAWREGGNQ